MLQLNKPEYESFLTYMESIDVSDMNQLYEMMDLHKKTYYDVNSSNSEQVALKVLESSIKRIIEESYDYRSDEFEDRVMALNESLGNIPRMILTEPLFLLQESVSEFIGDNNLLTSSQKCSMRNYPLDFVLCKMYSGGMISDRDMGYYKSSLESDVMGLVANMNLRDDMRADVNRNIPQAPALIHEMIHPNFREIEALYESYTKNKNRNRFTLENYTCTPSAIIDKVYLCNVDASQFIGLESESPTQYALTRQSVSILNEYCSRLEGLILESINENKRLLSFVKETVTNMKELPSVTSSVLAKLSVCCLMDMKNLYGSDGDGITERYLSNLIDQVDKYSISVDDLNRNEAGCLINFLKLGDTVNGGFTSSNTEISLECGNDSFHNSKLNNYVFNSGDAMQYNATSVNESSLESYESSMNGLLESFEIASDGTIKVTIKEKTTYMNEYAVNHRLLKYNEKQKDYEGMKYNLIYHMILIENIEKNVLYNKRVKKDSELYKDAEQARRNAKSDIATYLPVVRQHDKTFNLNDFYRQVKAEQSTISINGVETASGIKTIMKAIMI